MRIAIKAGPGAGQEHDIEQATVVGRDPANASLVLDDPEASRRHASLTPGGSGLDVEDLGSTNGTFVNGERIEAIYNASGGDEIRIGNTVIEVLSVVEVTQMAAIPEPAEPEPSDATAYDAPVPDAPPPAPDPEPAPPEPPAPEPFAAPPAPEPPTGPPPPPDYPATPPPPPAAGPPPPPGAAQGYGAPQQGYQPPPGGPGMGQPGGPMVPGGYTAANPLKTRESVVEWLLCIFVPFYNIFWIHRASKEMQQWSGGRIDYSAGATITALTIGSFVLIPALVAVFSFGGRIRSAQELAGVEPRASGIGFFGRLLLLGYGYKWAQDQFNEIAVRQPQG